MKIASVCVSQGNMERTLSLLLLSTLTQTICCYPFFQDRLPNGNFVPHPCKPNFVWKGVGHENLMGGGPRNPFGNDFAANGFKWDKCICKQDSDGDGKSNGEELGDPECTWTPGKPPKHKFGLSHPGVCEPMDSQECKARNSFEIDCSSDEEFECEAVKAPDVKNITVRFPSTNVPPKETTYVCMTFDLPNDEEYHMIAYEPIIDNHDVMHHIVVSGCKNNSDSSLEKITSPAECGMAEESCQEVIALWAVGGTQTCLPEEYGFRIGKMGYKTILVQMHWTNPLERTAYYDSSGMVLHYTPVLRNNSAQILQTGQFYLQIPPGHPVVHQDGTCTTDCSSLLTQTVYISEVAFHMHYLGHSGFTELWRDGVKVRDLIRHDDYDYDRPEIVSVTPPEELKAGDVLRTRCTFNSLNRNKITFFGDGSFDEMCIAFITIYPAIGFNLCGQYASETICYHDDEFVDPGIANHTPENDTSYDPCLEFFTAPDVGMKIANLFASCDENGAECLPGCQAAIDAFRSSPCFQDPYAYGVEDYFAYQDDNPEMKGLRYYLRSCDGYDIENDEDVDDDDNRTEQGPSGRDRYNPDTNGLPIGGVCPFTQASNACFHGPVWINLVLTVAFFVYFLF